MIRKLFYSTTFLMLSQFALAQIQIGIDIDGEAPLNRSGQSVFISGDGNTIAIGAFLNSDNGADSGQARIYSLVAGNWIQIGADLNGEAAGDHFGSSVTLSDDGRTLAVGAIDNQGAGANSGHVRVFNYTAGNWVKIGSDIDGEAVGNQSGSSVALSSDGTKVAIGARGNNGVNGSGSGHIRVYSLNSGNWIQMGGDIDGKYANIQFGWGVSMSSDGLIIAGGTPYIDDNGTDSGQVRVYAYAAGAWSQIGGDINGEAAGDYSGWSTSLSGDGSRIAIGAVLNDGNGTNSGHVRVYSYASGVWTILGNDINGEFGNDQSGYSVSLSSDGSLLAISSILNAGGSGVGSVRIYKYSAGNWIKLGNDIDGEAGNDQSGYSISLSSDGSKVAIGAPQNDGNGNNAGQVRVYDLNAVLATNAFVYQNTKIFPNPVKDEFHITFQQELELQEVNIYSVLGQFIKKEKTSTIKVSKLSKGFYYVEVITNKGKATYKILVD